MKLTPFYDQNGITIYCGDCLEIMPQLEGPFDAIIADLPYGTTACDWDSVIPLELLWKEYKRLIKRNGAIVLFGKQPFTSALVMSNLTWFRQEIIWDKCQSGGGFVLANKKILPSHENILLFYKHLPVYNPQMTKKDKGNIRPPKTKRKSTAVAIPMRSGIAESADDYNPELRYPFSILRFSSIKAECNPGRKVHPTQKPLDLLRYLIRTYTNPGDLILDNTMGSGTTLVAAQIEGRRAVGIDISEEYCQAAVDRLKPPGFLALLQENHDVSNGKQLSLLQGESDD